MKLIFITREGYNLGGARIRCYNFAREFSKYGVNTQVFSFADNLGAICGERESQMTFREKIKYNIKAFNLLNVKDKSIFYMQRVNYHTLTPFLISLLRKNKFILDCDDWDIRENPVYYLGFIPSSKIEFLTRLIAKYADICIASSIFLKDYLLKFNKKVYYVPTGVDTDTFKPKNFFREDNRIIKLCWIGTVYHRDVYTNLKFVIDSFTFLANKYKNIFLMLAGDGRRFEIIKEELKSNPYKNRIKIDNWLYPDKIPDYLNSIDIGLLPLIQDTKLNRAKSPTKLFEYMAMEKCTVATNTGEASLILEDGKDGFLANDKKDFINKIEILINDVGLRKKMGENSRKKVEREYSLKVLGKRLYEIVEKELNQDFDAKNYHL